MRLLDRCSIEPDSSVGRNAFFTDTHRDGAGCRQLIDVYAYRMADVWRVPHVVEWLAAQTALVVAGGSIDSEYARRWKLE
jgi:hypothetical protein